MAFEMKDVETADDEEKGLVLFEDTTDARESDLKMGLLNSSPYESKGRDRSSPHNIIDFSGNQILRGESGQLTPDAERSADKR